MFWGRCQRQYLRIAGTLDETARLEENPMDGDREAGVRFAVRFCGIALGLGALLALAGWYLRPVVIDKSFEVAQVIGIGDAAGVRVLSFRMLVFGLFIRIAGLVALGTLFGDPGARAVALPAVTICVALLGWGIHRGGVAPAWSGWAVGFVGFVAMMAIFFAPGSHTVQVAAFTALAAGHALLGGAVLAIRAVTRGT